MSIIKKDELKIRMDNVYAALGDDWDTAFILGRVNQFYLTGTMQDGVLVLKRGGSAYFFVRRSFERAKAESPLDNIYPMKSYKDAAAVIGSDCGVTYIDTETATLGVMGRLKKYFDIKGVLPLDSALLGVRMVKSDFELSILRRCGALHNDFLINDVPGILQEGISEAELTGLLYGAMIKKGHSGIVRFGMFQAELAQGQMGFGTNSLYPTNFDGPGGMLGMSPAVPIIGSRRRRLAKGDIVFLDFAFCVDGYHTDKSQVYSFGAPPPPHAVRAHNKCIEIQTKAAEQLKSGNIPSEIYQSITSGIDKDFLHGFMGYKQRSVRFLGHGTGLQVDELPVIANGFDRPLEANSTVALEPKKGIGGVGVVGVEDTYIVTENGGECITGGGREIIVV